MQVKYSFIVFFPLSQVLCQLFVSCTACTYKCATEQFDERCTVNPHLFMVQDLQFRMCVEFFTERNHQLFAKKFTICELFPRACNVYVLDENAVNILRLWWPLHVVTFWFTSDCYVYSWWYSKWLYCRLSCSSLIVDYQTIRCRRNV